MKYLLMHVMQLITNQAMAMTTYYVCLVPCTLQSVLCEYDSQVRMTGTTISSTNKTLR